MEEFETDTGDLDTRFDERRNPKWMSNIAHILDMIINIPYITLVRLSNSFSILDRVMKHNYYRKWSDEDLKQAILSCKQAIPSSLESGNYIGIDYHNIKSTILVLIDQFNKLNVEKIENIDQEVIAKLISKIESLQKIFADEDYYDWSNYVWEYLSRWRYLSRLQKLQNNTIHKELVLLTQAINKLASNQDKGYNHNLGHIASYLEDLEGFTKMIDGIYHGQEYKPYY